VGISDEKLKRQVARAFIAITPLSYLVGFFFVPVIFLALRVSEYGIGLNSIHFAAAWEIAAAALPQMILSVIGSLLIGLPLAGLLARFDFKSRRTLQTLVLLPFVLPTLVTGLAIRSIFSGLLEPGIALLVIAHVYVNLAVVVRIVGVAWESIDSRYFLIARTLGKSSGQVFRYVTLPLIRPAIARASALIAIFSFSSLGLVLVVGGSQRTLETQLLRQISLLVNFDAAAVTAILQFVFVLVVLGLSQLAKVRLSPPNVRVRDSLPRKYLWLPFGIIALLVSPLLWLLAKSFQSEAGWSFSNWFEVLSRGETWEAIASSASVAILSAVLATLTALSASFASRFFGDKRLQLLFAFPLAVSSVTLGLGLLLASQTYEVFALPRWLLPSIAHSLIALPFLVGIFQPPIAQLSEKWITLASSLGVSRLTAYMTAFTPVLQKVLPVGFAFAIAISLGEFGAASFLADPTNPTVSVLLSRLIARPAEAAFEMASVLAVLLAGVTWLLTTLWQRYERDSND
jgi:thiamine transport system permease protein